MAGKGNAAIIIGAGVGGLSLAIYLAEHGFGVDVLEQRDQAGGRCGLVERDGHRFDAGATLLLMPRLIESVFADWGEDMRASLRPRPLDPMYSLYFEGAGALRFSSDASVMRNELETRERGAYDAWLRYASLGRSQYDFVMQRVLTRLPRAREAFTPANAVRLVRLRVHRRHFALASRHFRDPALRAAFTFQNIYVGQNPFTSSAAWASIPAMEAEQGAWYPEGGMHAVVERLVELAVARGVRIHLGTPVERVLTDGRRATGVRLADGGHLRADAVVVNADLPYAYERLLEPTPAARRLRRRRYTSSAIVFHWGITGALDALGHHSVFLGADYAGGFAALEDRANGTPPRLSHFYVNRPAATDATTAPAGHESITVIVPAPHCGRGPRDWDALAESARSMVMARLASAGCDVGGRIAFEIRRNPPDWERALNLTNGSVFGSLDHGLDQIGCLRPANRHRRFRNLYFVGGSTHPGSGVPLVMLSGRLTARRMFADFRIPNRLTDACNA